MNKSVKSTLSAVFMSTALLVGTSGVALLVTTDSAFAKGNNGNNGNRGNSGSNGNNGNRGNSGNNGNGASSAGALNAAHANANAQANAASNSRVGLIQAYEAAVIATTVAQKDYEKALAAWTEFGEFESEFDDYADFSDAYDKDPTGLEDELAYWMAFDAISTSSSDLNASREIEDMALQLAANKETDEATIARLWDLLGL